MGMENTLCAEIWTWLKNYFAQINQGNLYLQLLAMLLALLFIYNIYLSITLCENQTLGDACKLHTDCTFDEACTDDLEACNEQCGCNQSPIDIKTCRVLHNFFQIPLIWSGYRTIPTGICLENNGHTLVLRAAFRTGQELPCVYGADLLGCYEFCEISFRWSWYSGYGSEHTIDNKHYALEMQCLHKDVCSGKDNMPTSSRCLLMISYMFEVSCENPFLDIITQHLIKVQSAGQRCEIRPFPLNDIMPAFCANFYSYHGSMTEPPYHSGAEWFISAKPQTISERQLHEFHKLCNRTGSRIGRNARAIQQLKGRRIHFNTQLPGR